MSVLGGSLRTFLASAKSTLRNAIVNQQRVTLVIGNESADLDSITSAILLAYLRSSTAITPQSTTPGDSNTRTSQFPSFYIPVINIPQADIKIRPELLALLPHANIEPSHLITLDDLGLQSKSTPNATVNGTLQPQLTRLLLVDHNNLAGPLALQGFSERVVGCVDHHVDEKTVPLDTRNEPRIIETCGSCNSLVTQYCRPAWDMLSGMASTAGRATSGQSDVEVGVDDAAVRRTWDAQVAKLALASVLIDTNNLADKNKTVDIDREAVDYLEAKILLAPGATGANWNRDDFFNEIKNAKSDLSKLEPQEILRKDYKQWEVKSKQLGISSAVKTLSWQVDHAGGVDQFKEVIRKFAADRELDYYSTMTTSTSNEGHFQRELLLFCPNSSDGSFIDRFEHQAQAELGLKQWQEKEGFGSAENKGKLAVWWQKEVQNSRKQVGPLMRKIIESE